MRRAIARALILPVLLAVPFVQGCQSETKRHLYKAEDLFEKRELEGAKKELELSLRADPNNLDAHKSLAHIDEFLGDEDGAAREYEAASTLDPADQKMLAKARYYKTLQDLANSADKALADVKAGKTEDGIRQLKDILVQSRAKTTREKALKALQAAVGETEKQGDQQLGDKKYADAIKSYEQEIRGYMLIAEAQNKQQLDSAADGVLHKINDAAKQGAMPDATFRVLNDVLTIDPDNKTANMELAQVYLRRKPPDYDTAADLEERGGASDADVKKLRAEAKRHRG